MSGERWWQPASRRSRHKENKIKHDLIDIASMILWKSIYHSSIGGATPSWNPCLHILLPFPSSSASIPPRVVTISSLFQNVTRIESNSTSVCTSERFHLSLLLLHVRERVWAKFVSLQWPESESISYHNHLIKLINSEIFKSLKYNLMSQCQPGTLVAPFHCWILKYLTES